MYSKQQGSVHVLTNGNFFFFIVPHRYPGRAQRQHPCHQTGTFHMQRVECGCSSQCWWATQIALTRDTWKLGSFTTVSCMYYQLSNLSNQSGWHDPCLPTDLCLHHGGLMLIAVQWIPIWFWLKRCFKVQACEISQVCGAQLGGVNTGQNIEGALKFH